MRRLRHAQRQAAAEEARRLAAATHRHVIGLHAAFVYNGNLCLVMELAAHGDLGALVRRAAAARRLLNLSLIHI